MSHIFQRPRPLEAHRSEALCVATSEFGTGFYIFFGDRTFFGENETPTKKLPTSKFQKCFLRTRMCQIIDFFGDEV